MILPPLQLGLIIPVALIIPPLYSRSWKTIQVRGQTQLVGQTQIVGQTQLGRQTQMKGQTQK